MNGCLGMQRVLPCSVRPTFAGKGAGICSKRSTVISRVAIYEVCLATLEGVPYGISYIRLVRAM